MGAQSGFGTQPCYEVHGYVWAENRIIKCSDKNEVIKAQSYPELLKVGPSGTELVKKKQQQTNTQLGQFLGNITIFQKGVLNDQVLLRMYQHMMM